MLITNNLSYKHFILPLNDNKPLGIVSTTFSSSLKNYDIDWPFVLYIYIYIYIYEKVCACNASSFSIYLCEAERFFEWIEKSEMVNPVEMQELEFKIKRLGNKTLICDIILCVLLISCYINPRIKPLNVKNGLCHVTHYFLTPMRRHNYQHLLQGDCILLS